MSHISKVMIDRVVENESLKREEKQKNKVMVKNDDFVGSYNYQINSPVSQVVMVSCRRFIFQIK